MSLVWYTTADLLDGAIFNTNDYCHHNRQALERASQVEQLVEDLLEEVRMREFPEAPPRICSLLVAPWPMYAEGQREREVKAYRFNPEPPGRGTHCYRVAPGTKGQRWMVDEIFTERLVNEWESLSELDKLQLARNFWAGKVRRGYSYLLLGEVKVLQRCVEPKFVD